MNAVEELPKDDTEGKPKKTTVEVAGVIPDILMEDFKDSGNSMQFYVYEKLSLSFLPLFFPFRFLTHSFYAFTRLLQIMFSIGRLPPTLLVGK